MIANERQYKITKSQMDKFLQSIEKLKLVPTSSKIEEAERDALVSQYEDLKSELEEFEAKQI